MTIERVERYGVPTVESSEMDAADELKVLCAAWLLADDDDRRTKALWVSPTRYRRWRRLAVLLAEDATGKEAP